MGACQPERMGRYAVTLEFGTSAINLGDIATGPVKSVIDNLYPIVGGTRGAPDDWRIEPLIGLSRVSHPPDPHFQSARADFRSSGFRSLLSIYRTQLRTYKAVRTLRSCQKEAGIHTRRIPGSPHRSVRQRIAPPRHPLAAASAGYPRQPHDRRAYSTPGKRPSEPGAWLGFMGYRILPILTNDFEAGRERCVARG